jgi:hypothetical protein
VLVQIFCPLMTNSPFSSRALVRSAARSEPAPGSEYPWHQTISPRSVGAIQRRFCSSLVCCFFYRIRFCWPWLVYRLSWCWPFRCESHRGRHTYLQVSRHEELKRRLVLCSSRKRFYQRR